MKKRLPWILIVVCVLWDAWMFFFAENKDVYPMRMKWDACLVVSHATILICVLLIIRRFRKYPSGPS